MGIHAQIIDPTPEDWRALGKAAGSKDAMSELIGRYLDGCASVLMLSGDAEGVVMLWAERRDDEKRELVAALGTGSGARAFIPWLIELAKANHAASIRTHCKRAGLIRLYEKHNFETAGMDEGGYQIMRWHDGR